MTNLLKKLALSSRIKERLENTEHPSELMKCWCGEMTPVYQPYAEHSQSGHGSGCYYCNRTVDEFYHDWVERVEYSNGSYSMKYLDGGSSYSGNRDDNSSVVKRWERSDEEASKYALEKPDFTNVLSGFPKEFQSFFIRLLELLNKKEDYFSGCFTSLSERWKYELLPTQIYELWKKEDYYTAISRMHRNIPTNNPEAIIPHNPFLTDGEILVIFHILNMLREKQKELEPKNWNGGTRWLSKEESVLRDIEHKIEELVNLPSGYMIKGSLDRRSVSDEMMQFILEHTKNSNIEEITKGLPMLSQEDLNIMKEENREKEISVFIQWPHSFVVEQHMIRPSFFVQDEWSIFTKEGRTIYYGAVVANVGFENYNSRIWLSE